MWTWKCYLLSEVMSWLISLCRWLLAKPPTLPPSLSLTHTFTYSNAHTPTHSVIYACARIAHTSSSGLPRLRWTTALPLCCTLLHLDLWASCIFNQGNLPRPCVCRRVLRQIDGLGPYLYSPSHTAIALVKTSQPQTLVQKIIRWYCFYHTQWSGSQKKRKRRTARLHSSCRSHCSLFAWAFTTPSCCLIKKTLHLKLSATLLLVVTQLDF